MKKTYEKPKLIALPLSGNNMLCNTCAIDIIGDNAVPEIKRLEELGLDISKFFAAYETDCTESDHTIVGYCKFNGADHKDLVVINS